MKSLIHMFKEHRMRYITLYSSITTDQDDVKFKITVLYSVRLSDVLQLADECFYYLNHKSI